MITHWHMQYFLIFLFLLYLLIRNYKGRRLLKLLGLFELIFIAVSVMLSQFMALIVVALDMDPLHLWLQRLSLQFDGLLYILLRYFYFCYWSQYLIAVERTFNILCDINPCSRLAGTSCKSPLEKLASIDPN